MCGRIMAKDLLNICKNIRERASIYKGSPLAKNRKCVFFLGGLLDSCFLKQPVGMSPSVDDVEHVTDVDTDAAC